MSLQDEDETCTVRIVKYLLADNNLYVVMQHCQQSLKGLLFSQRVILAAPGSAQAKQGAYVSDAYTRSKLMEPWEAAEYM